MSANVLPAISSPVSRTAQGGIREVGARIKPGTSPIRLHVGQPDFATPAHIQAAAIQAMRDGFTEYTPSIGFPSLREAIAEKVTRVNGYPATADMVMASPGGAGAIHAALNALLAPGDQVLIPDPGWPTFEIQTRLAFAEPVLYPCPKPGGFQPDLDALAGLITDRTRLIIVNNPNNPTGAVYPEQTLRAIIELAQRHNLWILADECYDEILLDGDPVRSMASLCDDGRVVSIYTFSKTYSMTGFRLGYAVAAAPVISQMQKVIEATSSCPSSISQKAGEAALGQPHTELPTWIQAYRRRREIALDLLRDAEMMTISPRGAFYLMADVSPSGLNSRDFAFRLVDEREVVVAPGTAFGNLAADCVRISLASSDSDVQEGITRLIDFAHQGR